MRNDPQFRTLELTEPARFSLGAGTLIASVHVKLDDIRERDLPPITADMELHERKRLFAEHIAQEMAYNKFMEAFAVLDDTCPDGRAVSYMTVHQSDSVTYEIWKQGPETRRVNLI